MQFGLRPGSILHLLNQFVNLTYDVIISLASLGVDSCANNWFWIVERR